jgi:hypothetical protein
LKPKGTKPALELTGDTSVWISTLSALYGMSEERILAAALECFWCVTNGLNLAYVGVDRVANAQRLNRAADIARAGGVGWPDRWHEALYGK